MLSQIDYAVSLLLSNNEYFARGLKDLRFSNSLLSFKVLMKYLWANKKL